MDWLAFLDTVRTEYYQDVINLTPLIPSIPQGMTKAKASKHAL
jgi:hypothetical protein